MCGITGIINLDDDEINFSLLKKMSGCLSHRGPDESGFFLNNNVGLANTRLSIVDIEGGHQPFISYDKKVVVIQNGEIYNYREIKKELENSKYECKTSSDTEVILRLYEKFSDLNKGPEEFVDSLNGMFSIAIHDERINKTWLIRDRLGIKPLYIAKYNKKVLFASEIKSILHTGFPRKINYASLDKLLTFNFVPPPSTLFEGINHLPPGTFAEINNHKIVIKNWWSFEKDIKQNDKKLTKSFFNEKKSNLEFLLKDSIKIRMRSDAPFGAFLSGGIDSSTVVGLMNEIKKDEIKTFSIGFNEKFFDETEYALEASKRFNTKHFYKKINPNIMKEWPKTTYYCDQPHGDISFIPTYEVAKLASKEVKMVLTGDGGDELFAGYDKYKKFFNGNIGNNIYLENYSKKEFEENYLNSITLFNADDKLKLYNYHNENINNNLLGKDFHSKEIFLKSFEKVEHLDRLNQVLAIDCQFLLPGNNLVKPDRMGMAASIEARTPFLDYRVVEESFLVPGEYKLNNDITKFILKEIAKPLIGDNLTFRKKQMFTVPIGEWMKKEYLNELKYWLFDKRTTERKIFNYKFIEEIFKKHITGKENRTRELRLLVAIEIWFRTFIDPIEWDSDTYKNINI
jgi:asparagine synthase (glutamine-hydrolysing)